MRKANLIVMGKTGAGKSTLINAVFGEKVAETGIGKPITQKNEKYEKQIIAPDGLPIDALIYDTVGLEIDSVVTQKTIDNIAKHIDETERDCLCTETTAVWFCVNWKCNRFEKYEIELIQQLSIDKCIPFIIVITQCLDNSIGDLEKSIREVFPEMPVMRILAESCRNRIGLFEAYGVSDLLSLTLNEYPRLKISIAREKFETYCRKDDERKLSLENRGKSCINKYSDKAGKVGWVPGGCIPIVHGLCIKMMNEMNSIFGLSINGEKLDAFIVGMVAAPLMAIPLLSTLGARAYIETIGEDYLKALMKLVNQYSNYETEQNEVILATIEKALGGK